MARRKALNKWTKEDIRVTRTRRAIQEALRKAKSEGRTFITMKEVCTLSGVVLPTLYRWENIGLLPTTTRFKRKVVRTYVGWRCDTLAKSLKNGSRP